MVEKNMPRLFVRTGIVICLFFLVSSVAQADDQSSANYKNKTSTFAPAVFNASSNGYKITGAVEPIVSLSTSPSFSLRHGVPLKEVLPVPTPTPTPTPTPGGGGGAGGAPAPAVTGVTLSGRAYPGSLVTALKDGAIVITTTAGPDAKFSTAITNLSAGAYNLTLYSEDDKGRRSSPFTFRAFIPPGIVTDVTGIFLSPTIDVQKPDVEKGDTEIIFGQSVPNGSVTLVINSDQTIVAQTPTDKSGAYLYNFDTAPLDVGGHTGKSKAILKTEISPFSPSVDFSVYAKGAKPPSPPSEKKCGMADLNCDGRVNLVDFSIAAYWYHRAISPEFAVIEKERLNGDGTITIVDFSIMAYYWTG